MICLKTEDPIYMFNSLVKVSYMNNDILLQSKNDLIEIKDHYFKKIISKEEIAEMVDLIAARINEDYKDKEPLFLVALKGAIFFAVDLLRKITIDCEIETVTAQSYGDNMVSSGNVLLSLSNVKLVDKDIIIIEDIVDSGRTMQRLLDKLKQRGAKTIETVALLTKPEQYKCNINIKYFGKAISPDFVIGYGMDYAEKARNLPDIYKCVSINED